MRQDFGSHRLQRIAFLLIVGCTSACQSTMRRAVWYPPKLAGPSKAFTAGEFYGSSSLQMAERAYREALERERSGDPACVDRFFAAAALAWADVQTGLCEGGEIHGRASEVYHSALTKLVTSGQAFHRLDPKCGLRVQTSAGWSIVPTSYIGSPWQPTEFDYVVPVGEYSTRDLSHSYRNTGIGVAAVAIHCRGPDEKFRRPKQVFSTTVVLRAGESTSFDTGPAFVLEFYDPLRTSSVCVAGLHVPLQSDITAPFAYVLNDQDRKYLTAFFQPGATAGSGGLFMIEPYQTGKIPLVLVHGLLSDPFTWAEVANEIRARPDLRDRFQIWGYEYSTGEPFLLSAAGLRRQLREIRNYLDPMRTDPALSNIVLVGHSMGGLVSKLQVTYSGEQIWQAVSNVPFENISATNDSRDELAQSFFFDPSPLVSRVVYIGTPHRGSPWARRPVGRLGSLLVEESFSVQRQHQQLVDDNPGVFSSEFARRPPTSIDLLKPSSLLLRTIDQLPTKQNVEMHSIIGHGYSMVGVGDADGVVPVASAKKAEVVSERMIVARHSSLHHDPEGVEELVRILRLHAALGVVR